MIGEIPKSKGRSTEMLTHWKFDAEIFSTAYGNSEYGNWPYTHAEARPLSPSVLPRCAQAWSAP